MSILSNTEQTVKLWPIVGLKAGRRKFNHSGSWRVWVLAHSLDERGCGWVTVDELRAAVKALGVNGATYWRWVRDACSLGLFSLSGSRYYLAGRARGAELLECQHAGSRPAAVRVDRLFKKGWRAWVWAAFISVVQWRENPLSREKMQALTGIQPRTQYQYEQEAGVTAAPNYGKLDKHLELPHYQEMYCNHAFEFTDYLDGGRGKIARRLPDTRVAPLGVSSLNRGRTGKINRRLKKNTPRNSGRGNGSGFEHLFHDTQGDARQAFTALVERGANLPRELWVRTRDSVRVTMWRSVFAGELVEMAYGLA